MRRGVEQEMRYTLRRPSESITKQALSWNHHGKRRKGRPRNMWRSEIESETKRTLKDLERIALDRKAWKDVVIDLCIQGATRRRCLSNVESSHP
jgi:cell wall assembly regulator SMI1